MHPPWVGKLRNCEGGGLIGTVPLFQHTEKEREDLYSYDVGYPLYCREATPARTFPVDCSTRTIDDKTSSTLQPELENWSQRVYSIPLYQESGWSKTGWKTETTHLFYNTFIIVNKVTLHLSLYTDSLFADRKTQGCFSLCVTMMLRNSLKFFFKFKVQFCN